MTDRSIRSILLPLIPFVIFSIGLFPSLIFGWFLLSNLNYMIWWQLLSIPFILYIGAGILYITELLTSGLFIRIFNITYKPGIYIYSLKEPQFLKWTIVCILYTPLRKMLEIFPLGSLKIVYFRLLGMKIGKNTLVGGVIKDPCITQLGDNVTMGEYAIIYGHIHNMQNQTIEINKVTIGNNCVIGAGAIIMPGVTIEDNTIIAAGALIPKNQHLPGNKIYGGIPAREIGLNKQNTQ